MLAQAAAEPFDSDQHLFEIKWDGTRCLAFIDGDKLRLQNRHFLEMRDRYPELRRCTPGLSRRKQGEAETKKLDKLANKVRRGSDFFKHLGREGLDPGAFPPRVGRQAGFQAGLLKETLAIPVPLYGYLGQ
jgi:hypothetical protein